MSSNAGWHAWFDSNPEQSRCLITFPFWDELRTQYEAVRTSPHEHKDVPAFQEIDAQLRKAYRWLEKAIAYLDGLHPPIEHRFDLGHGVAFASPRFERGFNGQHEQRIVGFPVLDEINITYQIVITGARL